MSIYSKRWKGTEAQLREALDLETWLSAEDAVTAGLADSISDSLAIAAHLGESKFKYRNAPAILLEAKASLPGLAIAGTVVDELFAEAK